MPYCIYAQCIGRRDFQPAPGRVGRFQNQKDCGTNSVLPSLSSGGKVDQSTNLPSRAVLWKLNCVSCGHDAARFEARGSEGVNPCVARVPIVREETERCKVGFTTLSPFASARCKQRERGRPCAAPAWRRARGRAPSRCVPAQPSQVARRVADSERHRTRLKDHVFAGCGLRCRQNF